MKHSVLVIAAALQLFLLIDLTKGHGTLLAPVGRGSRWRKFPGVSEAEKNYDDMSNYCGGYQAHFIQYGGKCGLCGDNYGNPTPRSHELGGKYGSGAIVETYTKGSKPEFVYDIKKSHNGYVFFEICNLDKHGSESEACFEEYHLSLADGSDRQIITQDGGYKTVVALPGDLTCAHCVVRWTYRAGNSVNVCADGTENSDCGNQETFKNCADVSIN